MGPKVDFMAQESSEEGGAFPQYGDCSTYCCRRKALAGAIGAAAMTAGGFPALAAGSAKVGAGDDTGLLGFVPKSVKICKGDKITWTSGKAAPHNIVFDEENVPAGVDAKALGQPEGEYLNEEGDTFSQTFSVAGKYNYFVLLMLVQACKGTSLSSRYPLVVLAMTGDLWESDVVSQTASKGSSLPWAQNFKDVRFPHPLVAAHCCSNAVFKQCLNPQNLCSAFWRNNLTELVLCFCRNRL